MVFFLAVLIILILFSASYTKGRAFNSDYISRDGIRSVKGIFVILILFSHAKGYVTLDSPFDEPYLLFQKHIGQMVVALFLFYSGYGITEQIKKRGFGYVKSIPTKRFPMLLLNFDIAVLLYILLGLLMGKHYTPLQLLCGFTAWEGIGNSSWYIFVTFALYLLTFLCFAFVDRIKNERRYLVPALALTALSCVFMFALKRLGKDTWWYNTAHLYALGMLYSCCKESIEKAVMKNRLTYLLTLGVLITGWVLSRHYSYTYYNLYYVFGVCFTLTMVAVTMKLKIRGRILDWFGDHIFSIYILQRIPMIALAKLGVAKFNSYLFIVLSIALTLPLAADFDILTCKLDKMIWKSKKTG